MMRFLIFLVFAAMIAAVIVELMWIGWAMNQAMMQLPLWMFCIIFGSHVATFFGIAALIDKRQAQARSLQPLR